MENLYREILECEKVYFKRKNKGSNDKGLLYFYTITIHTWLVRVEWVYWSSKGDPIERVSVSGG